MSNIKLRQCSVLKDFQNFQIAGELQTCFCEEQFSVYTAIRWKDSRLVLKLVRDILYCIVV